MYPGSYPFDLIFLDIDLGGMDGMALARKIRETDSEVPILFSDEPQRIRFRRV